MSYDFDKVLDRRLSESTKWRAFDSDVLPLWVADMDFAAAEPIVRALRDRLAHGVFGYASEPPELRSTIVDYIEEGYGWRISPDWLVFLPGVIAGFNLAIRAVASPGDGVLAQTPVYYPILWAPANHGCALEEMELPRGTDGRYGVDLEAFEAAIAPRTRLFVLCNPHNPVGRVYRRDELESMAESCMRRSLVICSDEIHCDLLFDGRPHVPVASLDPEVGQRTITLMAPSKTYNLAGLHFSMAVIQDPELRERFKRARAGLIPGHQSILVYTAALAAYRYGRPWLRQLLRYLEANREFLASYVEAHLPGLSMVRPEGTYLAWLDCRAAGLPGSPHEFFLERARVALNDGVTFGRGGQGYVRLNFGCPRPTLAAALDRMRAALQGAG